MVKFLEPKTPEPKPDESEILEPAYPPQEPVDTKMKPQMVNGADVEQVLILPKGFKTEYPVVAAMQHENAELRKQVAAAETKNKELSSKLEETTKAFSELTKKVESEKTKVQTELASQIASLRIENGTIKDEEKEEAVKTLSALPSDQLNVILEDTRKLSKTPTETPSPEIPAEDDPARNLSEKDQKKRELRKKLFGYEEVGGATNG